MAIKQNNMERKYCIREWTNEEKMGALQKEGRSQHEAQWSRPHTIPIARVWQGGSWDPTGELWTGVLSGFRRGAAARGWTSIAGGYAGMQVVVMGMEVIILTLLASSLVLTQYLQLIYYLHKIAYQYWYERDLSYTIKLWTEVPHRIQIVTHDLWISTSGTKQYFILWAPKLHMGYIHTHTSAKFGLSSGILCQAFSRSTDTSTGKAISRGGRLCLG